MNIHVHTDPHDFLHHAAPLLLRNEAENNLILGISSRLTVRPERLDEAPYMVVVEHDGAPVAAAMMTSPFPLVITQASEEAIRLIVQDLLERNIPLPGMLGPKNDAELFASMWQDASGMSSQLERKERIYQIDQVIHPEGVPGTMRAAREEDFERILEWGMGFNSDISVDVGRDRMELMMRSYISEERLFIWDHDGAVSTAGWAGPTPNGVRINFVYTPPEHRGHGYASACVAALSQQLLQSGRQFCFLFTDLANPTSNSIYQKIGYRPVCDFNKYMFGPREMKE